MTEQEWVAATDPRPMLRFLGGKTSDRKLRWLLCGCCRRLWPIMREDLMRTAIEVAERFADEEDFNEQCDQYHNAETPLLAEIDPRMHNGIIPVEMDRVRQWSIQVALAPLGRMEVSFVSQAVQFAAEAVFWASAEASLRSTTHATEQVAQAMLVRDIFGNPFRPIAVEPECLTSTVVALARGIYDERAFDRMPVLGDALMDAGCVNEDILNHCRSEGPHVRGCHVVDLLLGKE